MLVGLGQWEVAVQSLAETRMKKWSKVLNSSTNEFVRQKAQFRRALSVSSLESFAGSAFDSLDDTWDSNMWYLFLLYRTSGINLSQKFISI